MLVCCKFLLVIQLFQVVLAGVVAALLFSEFAMNKTGGLEQIFIHRKNMK